MLALVNSEGWTQIAELGLALVLSAAIGLERELRQKSAGLRTHTLVGVGAALFVIISKYGFTDVLVPREVVLDPSRVAAQIVTGVGFLGAGLIFVRRDSVVGLTTAAGIWVTAAVGAAAGAGLPIVAGFVTVIYAVVVEVETQSVGFRHTGVGGGPDVDDPGPRVEVVLQVRGRASVEQLAAELSEMDGVEAVSAGDRNNVDE